MSNAPSPQAETARGPQTVFWVAWTVVLGAKFLLAAQLAPFGDEAWYWQESRHLAWGYSDLPPATAGLIAFGELVFGHSTLGMRLPFLALGALLPLVMVSIGRRLFGASDGWYAGLLTLLMPLIGTLGLFALPDVPLTLASVLALDAFERAAATRRLRYWATLGIALGVAWLCHYRAAMLMLSGLVFLCITPRGRRLWRDPGLWLALSLASAGLVPTLVFNATHAWVALGFQLVERNPWAFHADALVQPLEQALVCTPLFYALLLWAAWRCLRRGHDAPYDLLAVCALVPVVGYFVLGCFADDTRFRVHWPIPGYLPLLLVLPGMLRELVAPAQRVLRSAALGMLVLGSGAAFGYLTLAALPGGAALLAGIKAFPEHLVGWHEAAAKTRELLATRDATVLVADNFMLAAELDFALNASQPIYVLDHPINAKHGRAAQLALWQRDENALRAPGLRKVLLVAEPSARRERERAAWMRSLCARIAGLNAVDALDLYDGRKRFRWYNGFSGMDATGEPCAAALD
jgi:4-amino-4-deoxy-L-arabinose transferase-like glycosyltransferase